MDENQFKKLHSEISSLNRKIALGNVAMAAILSAITKQPGIDVSKLTDDINAALLFQQLGNEAKPEGVSAANSDEFSFVRLWLRSVLPALPTDQGWGTKT